MSRFKTIFPFLFFSLTGILFFGCSREVEQPIPSDKIKATLVVEVMHHQWTIPNILVYLKKNVTEFPGENTSVYDLSLTTDQAGNVQFSSLLYGNYYLYVKGWDPVFQDTVKGYKPVVINDSSAAGGIVDDRIYVSE